METEVYMNRQIGLQLAAGKDTERGAAECTKAAGADDPDYENMTLTFRNREQPQGRHPAPLGPVPVQPRPPSESARVPPWLHRAITSLYVLLALAFLFCIILCVLVLMKNSEMSRQLWSLKKELWNATHLAQECQEEQRRGWSIVQRSIQDTTRGINEVKSKVQDGNQKLNSVPAEITQIHQNIKKILGMLETKTNTQPKAQ